MNFYEFGDKDNPIMVLIHGVIQPWDSMMEQIKYFQDDYHIYAVELNGHTQDAPTEFVSLEQEAKEIEEFFFDKCIKELDVLCGFSMGGAVAHVVWKNQRLKVCNLILDAAPLVPYPKFLEAYMTKSYINIIKGSKVRDSKTLANFEKYFLPKKYLESFLKLADNISEESVRNIVHAASTSALYTIIKNDSRILYLHGTKGNEIYSKKSAKLLKKAYPEAEVICYKGKAHLECAIYEPANWCQDVWKFLERGKKSS